MVDSVGVLYYIYMYLQFFTHKLFSDLYIYTGNIDGSEFNKQ